MRNAPAAAAAFPVPRPAGAVPPCNAETIGAACQISGSAPRCHLLHTLASVEHESCLPQRAKSVQRTPDACSSERRRTGARLLTQSHRERMQMFDRPLVPSDRRDRSMGGPAESRPTTRRFAPPIDRDSLWLGGSVLKPCLRHLCAAPGHHERIGAAHTYNEVCSMRV